MSDLKKRTGKQTWTAPQPPPFVAYVMKREHAAYWSLTGDGMIRLVKERGADSYEVPQAKIDKYRAKFAEITAREHDRAQAKEKKRVHDE